MPLRQEIAHALAGWDHDQSDAPWTDGTDTTPPNAARRCRGARRRRRPTADLFTDLFPYAVADGTIVIADDWEEWRTPQRRTERTFYWAHYRPLSARQGRDPDAVADLDGPPRRSSGVCPTRPAPWRTRPRASSSATSRAARPPTSPASWPRPSTPATDSSSSSPAPPTCCAPRPSAVSTWNCAAGRTSNAEISPHDQKVHEYQDDPDWIGDRFVRHGGRPSDAGYPDIHRLSNHAGDYRRLQAGLRRPRVRADANGNRPFYDPANLYTSDARLVVAKKNASVLKHSWPTSAASASVSARFRF